MLVTYYLPLADFRQGFVSRDKMIGLPKWPAPSDSKENFQRNLGKVYRRPLGGIRGWIGEDYICEIGKKFKFETRGTLEKADASIAFKRFYYDGNGSGYFSIGVKLSSSSIKIRNLLTIASAAEIEIHSHQFGETLSLDKALTAFIDLFVRGSSRKNIEFHCRDVFAGRRLAVIHCQKSDISDHGYFTNMNLNDFTTKLAQTSISTAKTNQDKTPTFIITSNRSCQEGRFSRLAIARLYAELFFMERAIDLISSSAVINMDSVGMVWLGNRLSQCTSRLTGRNKPRAVNSQSIYNNIVDIFSNLYRPGRIDDLINGLQAIGAKPGLARGVLQAMERPFSLDGAQIEKYVAIFKEGSIRMGGTYNITGGSFGAVGDHSKASEITQQSINLGNADSSDLAAELNRLLGEMKSEAKSPDHFTSLAAVAEAQASADSGNTSDAISALKKAGRWSLEVAEKIGVNVAACAIRAGLGL